MRSEIACDHVTIFPHQTVGSEEQQGLADFGVIKYYGWKKVTIFQLDVDSFENVRLPYVNSCCLNGGVSFINVLTGLCMY